MKYIILFTCRKGDDRYICNKCNIYIKYRIYKKKRVNNMHKKYSRCEKQ